MARDKPARYDAEQLAFLEEDYNKGNAGVKVLAVTSVSKKDGGKVPKSA